MRSAGNLKGIDCLKDVHKDGKIVLKWYESVALIYLIADGA
jgi:hypothetical protein